MHTSNHDVQALKRPAPQNGSYENVARTHFQSARAAAEQVRCQYSKPSKAALIRECLANLKAFIALSNAVRP